MEDKIFLLIKKLEAANVVSLNEVELITLINYIKTLERNNKLYIDRSRESFKELARCNRKILNKLFDEDKITNKERLYYGTLFDETVIDNIREMFKKD